MECPLCFQFDDLTIFHEERDRIYYQCSQCFLIFVPPEYHITAEAEKKRYLLHHNSEQDQGYVNFLSRIIPPVIERVDVNSRGLDFGSGPNPVLATLFKKKGYRLDIYDPYFAPNILKKEPYDFICATEVVEHFRFPKREFDFLEKMLNPGCLLVIMTRLAPEKKDFGKWFYIQDLTHIVFYTQLTLQWIALKYRFELTEIDSDIFVFTKENSEQL